MSGLGLCLNKMEPTSTKGKSLFGLLSLARPVVAWFLSHTACVTALLLLPLLGCLPGVVCICLSA